MFLYPCIFGLRSKRISERWRLARQSICRENWKCSSWLFPRYCDPSFWMTLCAHLGAPLGSWYQRLVGGNCKFEEICFLQGKRKTAFGFLLARTSLPKKAQVPTLSKLLLQV